MMNKIIRNWMVRSLLFIFLFSCVLGMYTPIDAKAPVKKKKKTTVIVKKRKTHSAPLPVVDDSPINPRKKPYVNKKPATKKKQATYQKKTSYKKTPVRKKTVPPKKKTKPKKKVYH